MKPTVQMLRQLESYIDDFERDPWYYGDYDKFKETHSNIRKWLLSLYEKAKEENDMS